MNGHDTDAALNPVPHCPCCRIGGGRTDYTGNLLDAKETERSIAARLARTQPKKEDSDARRVP